VQLELPWALGPPDGRYLVRAPGAQAASHVLVVATLGAAERRTARRASRRPVAPQPPPAAVTTGRATVVDAEPVALEEAQRWLAAADLATAESALATLARAVDAHRIASGDPAVPEPSLAHALVVRAGYGAGEQVADGRWAEARALAPPREGRRRQAAALAPHERLAALLAGRAEPLLCEELALRARRDLDAGRTRAAAVQLRLAFEAALTELARSGSHGVAERLAAVGERREAVEALAAAALADALAPDAGAALAEALARLEAALRARAALTVR